MKLTLIRKYKKKDYSIGNLYIDGEWFCNTLEDTDRELYQGQGVKWIDEHKVYGKTAIPYGTYKITLNVISPKYSQKKQYKQIKGKLPRLLDVPGFEGILIHIGNYPQDTAGCILVGENRVKGGVLNSSKTFWALYERLYKANEKGEEITITIIP